LFFGYQNWLFLSYSEENAFLRSVNRWKNKTLLHTKTRRLVIELPNYFDRNFNKYWIKGDRFDIETESTIDLQLEPL
jgi:hypothetical protein